MPKVTVVCAWYNRAGFIKQTVDSLLNQDFDDFEIIIANDGSSDPAVKRILDSYDQNKLTIIHKKNEGFTKTIRMLMQLAESPFVAIQGAGDISYKDRLRKQYEFLSVNSDVGAVGSGCDVEQERGGVSRYKAPIEINTLEDLQKNVPFTHGTIMYRKSSFEECGGYDVRFKYCSDWDLYFRLLRISKIKSIRNSLYKKMEFNDGFSFSPEHKFSQELYKDVAVYCGADRELIVESLSHRDKNIQTYKPYYLCRSLRFSLAFLKRKDYRKSWDWFKYFVKSASQLHRNLKL